MKKYPITFQDVKTRLKSKYDQAKPTKKQKLQPNLYELKTNTESYSLFTRLHFHFKNKLLVPGVWIVKKVLGKHLIRKIPNKPWNKNFQILDKSIDEALVDWNVLYRRNGGADNKRLSIATWKKRAKTDYACLLIKDMEAIVNSHNLRDSAYRELFNMLMFRIQKNMNEYYNKERFPNGVGHLLYGDGSIYDPEYFILFREIHLMPQVAMRLAKNENKEGQRDEIRIFTQVKPVDAPKNTP